MGGREEGGGGKRRWMNFDNNSPPPQAHTEVLVLMELIGSVCMESRQLQSAVSWGPRSDRCKKPPSKRGKGRRSEGWKLLHNCVNK